MNDEDVARAIAAFEIEFHLDDSHLRHRFRRLQLGGAFKVVAVTALLGLAWVLLAVGLGTARVGVWLSGLVALGLCVVVDLCYHWRMRRAR